MTIAIARSYADDIVLVQLRGREAQQALTSLADDPAALRLTSEAVSSGASFPEPFDALLHIARQDGQRGLLDGLVKAGAMEQLLARAGAKAPTGGAAAAIERARSSAAAAHASIDGWLYSAGGSGSLDTVVSSARVQLADAARALRAA